ncbi:MAG: hypothetical protein AAF539_05985 [Planctomycetota bacterium]
MLLLATILALIAGNVITVSRLRRAESELTMLRKEVGYLPAAGRNDVVAARVPTDEALTYRFRVRVPDQAAVRLAYSTWLPKQKMQPNWYSAIVVPPGESMVTIRIAEDPRDQRWKVSALVRGTQPPTGTRRMGTVLPSDHVAIFRGTHDVISNGVSGRSVKADRDKSLRLLDERWIIGGQALLLYGDRPADDDLVGVFAELQPADRSL